MMKTKKTLCLTPQELYEAVEKWLKEKQNLVVKVKDIRYHSVFNYEIETQEPLP